MATIRKVVVNLTAGTAELFDGVERSGAKMGQFGQQVQTMHGQIRGSMIATSGAIRLVEGNLTNNMRAVERFLAMLPGVGSALQAAFPVVGALATAGIFVKMGEEAYKFFRLIEDAPAKLSAAFRDLTHPVEASNDALQISIDKVQMQIDVLQGKHPNNLKLALDEAKESADSLTTSLDNTFQKLYKALGDNEISKLRAFFTFQMSTSDRQLKLGGRTGSEEEVGKINKIADEGRAELDKITEKTPDAITQRNAIRDKTKTALAEQFAEMKREREDEIKALEKLATDKRRAILRWTGMEDDPTHRIKTIQGEISAISKVAQTVPLQFQLEDVREKEQKLHSDKVFEKPANIINERLIMMGDKLAELKMKFAEIGQTDSWKAQIEGITEAHKALDELAKPLALRLGRKLDANDPNASRGLINSIAPGSADRIADIALEQKATEVETAYEAKLFSTNLAIKDRIATLFQLGNAINKGYEATRNAGVEIELRRSFGDRYNDRDAKVQADIEADRQKLRLAADKEHGNQILNTTTTLGNQIELEKSLLAIQEQGADVIARVTLAYRLRDLARNGASSLQIQQETVKLETELARLSKAELTNINDKIAATKALNAAAFQGEEAQRKAALQSKYDEMTAHGKDDLVPATRTLDELEHQRNITEEAAKRVTIYRDQIGAINDQVDLLHVEAQNGGDLVQIGIALKDLEDQRLKVLIDQSLAMGRAKDGMRAFFLEMQQQGEKTAKIIYDAMNSAVDKLSDNLTRLLSGQKTAWADMFKSIGTDLLKQEIKKEISKGLGDLGKLLGIKPDLQLGATAGNAMWVRWAGGVPIGVPAGGQVPGAGSTSTSGTGAHDNVVTRAIERLREIFHRPAAQQDPWHPSNFAPSSVGLSPALGNRYSPGPSGRADDPVYVMLQAQGQKQEGVMSWLPGLLTNAGQAANQYGQARSGGDSSYSGEYATGGDIPSGSYGIAGEAGPEKVFGPAHVVSSRDSFGGGSTIHNHYYTIDNRGAELGSENRMRAMLKEVHSASVTKSVQASAEREKRMPQRTR